MKLKITQFRLAFLLATCLMLLNIESKAQTHFFQDAVQNGTIWHAAASEIANPLSDAVNSSSIVIQNTGAGGWQDTQLFPTSYTVQSGDKFFISFYNPNGAANWQLRMDLSTTGAFTQIGGSDPAHTVAAASGWNEVSLDLASYVGEDITKIQIYPAAGESISINFDNIYVATSSVIVIPVTPTTTYFFQDAVENGTIWHAAASEIANPLSDGVNSSSTVIQNTGSGGWQDTQLFPSSYTVKSGDKFYISFYNPNGAANWQLRMDLSTTGSFTQISGGDPAHAVAAASGWNEVSLDLASYVDEDITKIQIYPASGESISINFDNIYISTSATVSLGSPEIKTAPIFFIGADGNVNFLVTQINTKVFVYDLTGRLVLEEMINGSNSINKIIQRGTYIVRVVTSSGTTSQKRIYE